VFSATPDGSTFLRPDGVTQRYERLAERLGIETTFHKLRHYSATELIAGGVDPRTVAGRLGHGGGGTTTLKTYTAWVSEADQRAARGLGAGMPQRPVELEKAERARTAPRYPYEVVAVALAGQVTAGTLPIGSFLPPSADIAVAHGVSVSTAKRALLLARDWGLVERVGRNRLRVVDAISTAAPSSERATTEPGGDVLLDLVIRHRGTVVARFSSVVDHRSATELHQVLVDAVDRLGGDISRLPEYEMDLRAADKDELITTFVASRRRPS
jgi:integrase